jgi:hypothetical protein
MMMTAVNDDQEHLFYRRKTNPEASSCSFQTGSVHRRHFIIYQLPRELSRIESTSSSLSTAAARKEKKGHKRDGHWRNPRIDQSPNVVSLEL